MFNLQQFIADHVICRPTSMFAADIEANKETLQAEIRNKSVCVIGGAGSIGSSFIKAVLPFKPSKLIVIDLNENGLAELTRDLRSTYGMYVPAEYRAYTLNFADPIFERIFREEKGFDIVANFSAHKHVRSEKDKYSVQALIENNDIKAKRFLDLLAVYPPRHFFCVSTDKAANPVNIMGASKRLCEMVIQTMDKISRTGREDLLPLLGSHYEDSEEALAEVAATCENPGANGERKYRTEFVAVRFGNVLGSNGSVIPLFKKQIAKGGPVTVTHPDIIRYFMTIPEAVSLVIQAGAYAKGGEIFILDMGEPVKIDDLAKNLIRLSGYTLGVDMEIKYTGLRPGEKLYEELLMAEEGLQDTQNKLIHIGKPIEFDKDNFEDKLEVLKETAYKEDAMAVRRLVKEFVPTYKPDHVSDNDIQ